LTSGTPSLILEEVKMQEVTDQSFEQDVLKSEQPVLVDFWAEWCGPCKMIAPTVEQVAQQYEGRAKVVKMNVDENNQVPQRYGIKGIPTLILFKDGSEADRVVGATSRDNISRMIDRSLGMVDRALGS
jgi:thioredoxin 1